jgi:hypothetical protein
MKADIKDRMQEIPHDNVIQKPNGIGFHHLHDVNVQSSAAFRKHSGSVRIASATQVRPSETSRRKFRANGFVSGSMSHRRLPPDLFLSIALGCNHTAQHDDSVSSNSDVTHRRLFLGIGYADHRALVSEPARRLIKDLLALGAPSGLANKNRGRWPTRVLPILKPSGFTTRGF